ncbi:TIGR02281 family clan AA aspartic protease [Brevundimonas sp. M20]|uniref:retropepsin-like aspartic protease family protein n=1 Tax=Brevundimonas sp. M20 TaxID=2591463 RepID=UPI001F10DD87|nr:TIGR02281 family clan AA aspartic protease [Brevundimonas sp. M20]
MRVLMRFDLSSLGVLGLAVASSLTVLWWMDQSGLRNEAQAAESAAISAPATGGPAQVLKEPDGHYWADVRIDGRAIHAMVDTGASVMVLTKEDAVRLGLGLKPDDFDAKLVTASGPVAAAPVRLRSVSVSGARVENVEALVVAEGLPHSLLGMSYLGRLSSFTATPAALTLTP